MNLKIKIENTPTGLKNENIDGLSKINKKLHKCGM